MDHLNYTAYVSGLLVIMLLLVGLPFFLKVLMQRSGLAKLRAGKRVQILEVTPLDPRRRLILIRKDGDEHLLLIGGPNDLVVDSKITKSSFAAELSAVTLADENS